MNNKSVKSGFRIGCQIFEIAVIIALPLRIFQFFTVIEGGTGFYTENNWSVYLLYGIIAATIISLLFFGISKRKKLEFSNEIIKRPGLAAFSLISAGSLLLDAYNCYIKAPEAKQTAMMNPDSASNSNALILYAEAIFAVLAAVYFLTIFLTFMSGKNDTSKIRILALSPVVWSIFRIVTKFMRTISYVRVSELLFEMIMIAFMIMFFMAHAQASTGIGAEKTEWKIGSYGLISALMALICFVPRFVLTISGNTELFYAESQLDFCDLGLALFMIATVLTRVTDRQPENIITDSSEG